MDVSAILDENLDILSRPAASKAAQFLLVLSLIDRTILPREIALTAGGESLVLAVAERKAQLAGGPPLAARDLAGRIVRFCRETAVMQHKVRAVSPVRLVPGALGVPDIVNAQEWTGAGSPDDAILPIDVNMFAFDAAGWPLRMPESADAKAMVSAWLLHLWMQSWLKRRAAIFGERILLATAAGTSREIAFHIAPEKVEIVAVGPTELGRLLASWRVVTGTWRGKPGGSSDKADPRG